MKYRRRNWREKSGNDREETALEDRGNDNKERRSNRNVAIRTNRRSPWKTAERLDTEIRLNFRLCIIHTRWSVVGRKKVRQSGKLLEFRLLRVKRIPQASRNRGTSLCACRKLTASLLSNSHVFRKSRNLRCLRIPTPGVVASSLFFPFRVSLYTCRTRVEVRHGRKQRTPERFDRMNLNFVTREISR